VLKLDTASHFIWVNQSISGVLLVYGSLTVYFNTFERHSRKIPYPIVSEKHFT